MAAAKAGAGNRSKSSSAKKKSSNGSAGKRSSSARSQGARRGSAKKSTAKKGTRSRTGSNRSGRGGSEEFLTEENYELLAEAGIWVLLALCVLLFLANFGVIGTVGNVVSSFLFGVFGAAAYVFPFALFFTTVLIVANRANAESVAKGIMIWVVYLITGMFFAMAWGGDFLTRKQSYEGDPYFRYGTEFRRGGGFISGHLYSFTSEALGQFGTVIIMITLLLICIGVLTGRSIIKLIKESSREAADNIADNIEYYQEEIRHTRRERRRSEGIHYGRPHPTGDKFSRLKLVDEERESDEMRELSSDASSQAGDGTFFEASGEPDAGYSEHDGHPAAYENESMSFTIKEENEAFTEDAFPAGMEEEAEPETETEEAAYEQWEEDSHEDADSRPLFEDAVITPKRPLPDNKPVMKERSPKREIASSKIPDGVAINHDEVTDYVIPDPSMLTAGSKRTGNAKKEQAETAARLKETLQSFGVNVQITDVSQGPTVTRYEMLPEKGVKVSKIVGLTDDLKLALAAENIRIEAPIPGKPAVGIEVPNRETVPVMLHDLIVSDEFVNSKSKISFAVGKDIAGKPVVYDIAKMPHVLIAGATGAGKSVCINTIIMSILFKARPDEVKLVMIDPKVVELSIYNGIPHLMTPVVCEPDKAAGALNWSVIEMDRRYNLFASHAVRDLKGYNAVAKKEGLEVLPQIVIIVDELADLMMAAKSDVETAIVRLAQKARAAGMHLIIATQRPSVDVITGLIKANMPSRIAFTVTSGTDSRTILDTVGAEKLLGRGDMLFHPVGMAKPARVQGAFVSDEEVDAVASFIRAQKKDGSVDNDITEAINQVAANTGKGNSGAAQGAVAASTDEDEIFMQAAEFAVNLDKETVSIGLLQRRFSLGFNRAARIMDQLSEEGIVGEAMGTKGRKIVMTPEQFESYKEERA